MQELLVISGKGGTGKTTLVAAFAAMAKDKVVADCDVDAADLHLLLQPQIVTKNEFFGLNKAVIDAELCTKCGSCEEICRFNAIKDFSVDPLLCEGCNVCRHVCPSGAIIMEPNRAGYWYVSNSTYGPMVHAQLGLAEDNSGKLVTVVRQAARELAKEKGHHLIITDGPPGIGCPVISSLTGVSLALLVTEPTVAGRHDLERVLRLARYFKVPAVVCINKYDLAPEKSQELEDYCRQEGIEVAGKIPFDEDVNRSLLAAVPLTSYSRGKAAIAATRLWENLMLRLESV
ncbi:MAG: 4Fe-4S binding protein [Clostridia bacterium]|nr:4Fe-4S binding protein [Clostridia bacterium]